MNKIVGERWLEIKSSIATAHYTISLTAQPTNCHGQFSNDRGNNSEMNGRLQKDVESKRKIFVLGNG